jgi:hypothetical protein
MVLNPPRIEARKVLRHSLVAFGLANSTKAGDCPQPAHPKPPQKNNSWQTQLISKAAQIKSSCASPLAHATSAGVTNSYLGLI